MKSKGASEATVLMQEVTPSANSSVTQPTLFVTEMSLAYWLICPPILIEMFYNADHVKKKRNELT